MENNDLVRIHLKDLWPVYIEFMKGKTSNPFLQCGCITPKTIVKPIKPLIETTLVAEKSANYGTGKGKKKLTKKDKETLVKTLTREMQQASRALEFERAAELRDMILELDGTLPAQRKSSRSY